MYKYNMYYSASNIDTMTTVIIGEEIDVTFYVREESDADDVAIIYSFEVEKALLLYSEQISEDYESQVHISYSKRPQIIFHIQSSYFIFHTPVNYILYKFINQASPFVNVVTMLKLVKYFIVVIMQGWSYAEEK